MSNNKKQQNRKSDSEDKNTQQLSRRDFFTASSFGAAGLFAASCSNSGNPVANQQTAELGKRQINPAGGAPAVGNSAKSVVASAGIDNYDAADIKATIQSCFEAVGGVSDIVKGGTVGIKINMTGGASTARKTPRDYGEDATELYWSHPEILKATGELLKDAGASRIVVVEAIYDPESYEDFGYQEVVEYLGAEFFDINKKTPYDDFKEVVVPNPLTHWESYLHSGILHDFDCFVSLPKTKRHYGGGMTNAMKNMIGSTPLSVYQKSGAWREKLHATNASGSNSNSYEGFKSLVRTIVDLNKIRPIHLAVCDAIKTADNGEGPWNNGFEPRRFDKLFVSKDVVAADAYATTLFGFDPTAADLTEAWAVDSLPGNWAGSDNYLVIAKDQGLGENDMANIEVVDATVSTHVAMRG